MKLIKLMDNHYVIVNDEEIKVGDIVLETYIDGSKGVEHIQTLNDIDTLSPTVAPNVNTNPLTLGKARLAGNYFPGRLAHFALYNRTLGVS